MTTMTPGTILNFAHPHYGQTALVFSVRSSAAYGRVVTLITSNGMAIDLEAADVQTRPARGRITLGKTYTAGRGATRHRNRRGIFHDTEGREYIVDVNTTAAGGIETRVGELRKMVFAALLDKGVLPK